MYEWTDDLSLPLPAPHTVADVADVVLAANLAQKPYEEVEALVVATFEISADDAEFACERIQAGLIRSANPLNRPDPAKDPFAFESYQRAREDPTLLARILPQFAPKD